jgi:hypothetical protein
MASAHAADIPPVVTQSDRYVEGGRVLEVGRGWAWIADGYGYFRKNAGVWILLTVILLALVIAFHVIPVIGWLATTLLVPVFVGGLMAGCQAIERGAELELAHFFAGFRRNTGQLMLIGLIGFGLTAAVLVPAMLIVGAGGFFAAMTGDMTAMPMFGMTALLAFLLVLALMIPLNMALWFAPALVMLQDQSAPRAVGQSFRGCLRNIIPFLIYGLILFVLAIIASIPFGLGWLVLAPVVLASVYAAYRDIYCQR